MPTSARIATPRKWRKRFRRRRSATGRYGQNGDFDWLGQTLPGAGAGNFLCGKRIVVGMAAWWLTVQNNGRHG